MFNTPTYSILNQIVKELGISHTPSQYNDDISELDDKFVVELELPGFKKTDIEMSIEEDGLMVTATKLVKESDTHYLRKKRSDATFTKLYRMGVEVDVEKIEATLADGLLTITLPKGGETPKKKIEIT